MHGEASNRTDLRGASRRRMGIMIIIRSFIEKMFEVATEFEAVRIHYSFNRASATL